jgi:hypothetical protein
MPDQWLQAADRIRAEGANTPSASREPVEQAPSSYIMKNPSPKIWGPAARMTEREGRSLRWVILEVLRRYGKDRL